MLNESLLAGEEAPLTFKSKRRRSERRPSKADWDSKVQGPEALSDRYPCESNAVCAGDNDAARQPSCDASKDRQQCNATDQVRF